MKTFNFVALTVAVLSATVVSAPVPQLNNIVGSVTNPSVGDENVFEHNGNGNGVCSNSSSVHLE
jgi:hypothetical protein